MGYSRTSIARQAATLLENGFVLIDLETTGLDKDPHVEIVEVAVLNHEGDVLLDTLVKPRRPIPFGASRVHGLYDGDVAGAPPFEDVYDRIAALLNNQSVVAYNHTFERNILNAVCRQHDKSSFAPSQWWCAMRNYQKFAGHYKWFRLTEACRRERIVIDNAHRAVGDCQMTLALLRKMAETAG